MSLKDLITENDNSTGCLVRYSCAAIVLVFLGGTVYDTVHSGVFHFAEYANAAWPLLGAVGAAIAGKSFVENRNVSGS